AEEVFEDKTIDRRNLRNAKATDVYILKGNGLETFEPRFTYHGFRYVEVLDLLQPSFSSLAS
ncbi:MAG: family 78 glycoside hydrolase catalytic domain, partial [Sulfolobus sp.]|nr:family 78 glycoside hydrolase catalytic domain [Sulfolobus sp.]